MVRIVLIIISLLFTTMVRAQEESKQELSFVYIAHDENTDTKALISRLKEKYANTINYPDIRACIFYLANGENPIFVKMNMPNDNHEDFENIVYSLQTKRSHDISPEVDVEKIVELFNENDIIDADGKQVYRYIEWDYYINSSFWHLQNNEHIIAKLFFVMDMDKLISSQYMALNFYYSDETDNIPYDNVLPFGSKALCRSIEFVPMPY